MNEWLTNLLVAVILLCVWILAVLYYLSKMDRKNEEIKQACTERVIGRVDRMASLLINEGLKPYGQPLKMKYRNSFTYQRNMFTVIPTKEKSTGEWMDGGLPLSFLRERTVRPLNFTVIPPGLHSFTAPRKTGI